MAQIFKRHKNHDIVVDENGKFSINSAAVEETQELEGKLFDSLDAATKAIDRAVTQKVESTDAFVLSTWGGRDDGKGQMVRAGKVIPSRYGAEVWITNKKSKDRSKRKAKDVFKDTPANRELLQQWVEARDRLAKASKEADALEARMESMAPKGEEK